MTNKYDNTEQQLELYTKVPKDTLQKALSYYSKSTQIGIYVKFPFVLIAIMVVVHNIFIAGKSYNINTYDTILYTELTIVGIIVTIVIIMGIIAIINNLKLKTQLTYISDRYKINSEKVQDQFNLIAVSTYGGQGFTFKTNK